jgi:hypothetical protein
MKQREENRGQNSRQMEAGPLTFVALPGLGQFRLFPEFQRGQPYFFGYTAGESVGQLSKEDIVERKRSENRESEPTGWRSGMGISTKFQPGPEGYSS